MAAHWVFGTQVEVVGATGGTVRALHIGLALAQSTGITPLTDAALHVTLALATSSPWLMAQLSPQWVPHVARQAPLTEPPGVSWSTGAARGLPVCVLKAALAVSTGTVAWAGAAVAWGPVGGITIVARLALVTLSTLRVVPAALALASLRVALSGVPMALTALTGAQV